MIGSYFMIPLDRQLLITKIAHRKRRHLSVWENQKIAIWRRALNKNEPLPEQQRFFMRSMEDLLICKGWLGPEQEDFIS